MTMDYADLACQSPLSAHKILLTSWLGDVQNGFPRPENDTAVSPLSAC